MAMTQESDQLHAGGQAEALWRRQALLEPVSEHVIAMDD